MSSLFLQGTCTCPAESGEGLASNDDLREDNDCPSAVSSSGDTTSSDCPCHIARGPVGLEWEQTGSPATLAATPLAT